MTFHELAQPLRGIIPPMVTPLAGPDTLDEPGLERLVEHLVGGGVHGLFILGTCGEGPSLSPALRRRLVTRVCQLVDGRIPVLVGITDTSLTAATALADHAADVGADAVVLAPPFYYDVQQAELLEFVRAIARSIELPTVLYNMPGLTKVAFEPETIRSLMDEDPIVALKDSSGDLAYFQTVREVTRARPAWNLLIGPEQMLVESLRLGGDGGISGGANLFPQLFVELYDAAVAGEASTLATLNAKAATLATIYDLEQPSQGAGSVIRALKAGLEALEICDARLAEPLASPSSALKQQVEQVLQEVAADSPQTT